jgi:hypothetical protein
MPLRVRQGPPPPRVPHPRRNDKVGESSGAALPRGVGGSDARVLELARVPWAAAFEVGDDVKDDKDATVCNTLESRLAWAHRAFDKLILPTMSVSLLRANDALLISRVLPRCVAHLRLVWDRCSRRLVGGERARREKSVRIGPSWRCNWSWLKWQRRSSGKRGIDADDS